MVSIRRVDVPPPGPGSNAGLGRDLHAGDHDTPFGGSRLIVTDDGQRGVWSSWGPAGDLTGHPSRAAAESVQIHAHRRNVGDQPAPNVITRIAVAVPIRPPARPAPPARSIDQVAADYEHALHRLPGRAQARKRAGAHYTPAELVETLIDEALQPLIDEAVDQPTVVDRITALAAITVCDPACGSGAFPAAAARRIGCALAVEDTGVLDPTDDQLRLAVRAVVARNIHGVDLSAMAVELCKAALWLEGFHLDLPLPHLGDKIRRGNALLGATPALLAAGIPDAAYTTLDGDDPKVVAELRRRNAAERDRTPTSQPAQEALF